MLSFREARRADLPAIVALLADDMLGSQREGSDMGPYEAAFDAMAAQPGNLTLVGVDAAGKVVATCQLTFIAGLSLGAMRRAQVESVRVAASLRGQGAGRAMFAEVERRARAAGCGLIQLTMNGERSGSRMFYDALGFTPSHIGFKKYL